MMLETPDQIAMYRLLTLRQMLRLELKGLKRRGRSAYAIIKDELGLKGSKKSVYEQLNTMLGIES